MRNALPVLLSAMIALGSCKPSTEPADTVATSDESAPHTVLTKTRQKAKGVVLLFHQAGSNLHEYDPVVPLFNALGYDALAVDQRSGGTMWGHENTTAQRFDGKQGYMDAYADMVAALSIAEAAGYDRIVVCGSSYSASLAMRLASEHSTVSAVLAFSPGEYFDEKGVVSKWNSLVKVPTLVAATKDEISQGVYDLYESAPRIEGRSGDVLMFAKGGVHGASALRKDKCPEAHQIYWGAVETFLKAHFAD